MTEQEVIERLRGMVSEAGGTRAFARTHELSAAYISDILRGRRTLSDRILAIVGVEKEVLHVVTYRPKKDG